jgi:hypothetical protein
MDYYQKLPKASLASSNILFSLGLGILLEIHGIQAKLSIFFNQLHKIEHSSSNQYVIVSWLNGQ